MTEQILLAISKDINIYRIEGGDYNRNKNIIHKFEQSARTILINCRVLGEGVDIPCADSVCILYSKFSYGDITQMILRAGRWNIDKKYFHVLLPATNDIDQRGIENVLDCLSQIDGKIKDEIIAKSSAGGIFILVGYENDDIIIRNSIVPHIGNMTAA